MREKIANDFLAAGFFYRHEVAMRVLQTEFDRISPERRDQLWIDDDTRACARLDVGEKMLDIYNGSG